MYVYLRIVLCFILFPIVCYAAADDASRDASRKKISDDQQRSKSFLSLSIASWQLPKLSTSASGELVFGTIPHGALDPTELEIVQSCAHLSDDPERKARCVRLKESVIAVAKEKYLPVQVGSYNRIVMQLLRGQQ